MLYWRNQKALTTVSPEQYSECACTSLSLLQEILWTFFWSWKRNQDICFCHSRWCITVWKHEAQKAPLSSFCIPFLGASVAAVTRVRWRDFSLGTAFLIPLRGFCRLVFQLEFKCPRKAQTCASWKPVTISCDNYSQGRTGKLECTLLSYRR